MAAREAELLSAPYFHIVFTLPSAIGDIAYPNNAGTYDRYSRTTALHLASSHIGPSSAPPEQELP
jgi:hypothetical protein